MIYLAVPHDVFDELIDYIDKDDRFYIDTERYIHDDSSIVLCLSESGKEDSLIIDTPNESRCTMYLVNDMSRSIESMINYGRRFK